MAILSKFCPVCGAEFLGLRQDRKEEVRFHIAKSHPLQILKLKA